MLLISPNFIVTVSRSFFPNFGQGPFPKITGKSPESLLLLRSGGNNGDNIWVFQETTVLGITRINSIRTYNLLKMNYEIHHKFR